MFERGQFYVQRRHQYFAGVNWRNPFDVAFPKRIFSSFCPYLPMVACSCVLTIPVAKVSWKFCKSTVETHQECHHFEISNYLSVKLIILQVNQKSFDICIVFFEMFSFSSFFEWARGTDGYPGAARLEELQHPQGNLNKNLF